MMKRILIGLLALGLIGGAVALFQWNKPHRDASSEKATYSFTDAELLTLFINHPDSANDLLLDQVVEVTGVVSSIDGDSLPVFVLSGVAAEAANSNQSADLEEEIKLKGRVTLYDDLFEEVRLDQAIILKD